MLPVLVRSSEAEPLNWAQRLENMGFIAGHFSYTFAEETVLSSADAWSCTAAQCTCNGVIKVKSALITDTVIRAAALTLLAPSTLLSTLWLDLLVPTVKG